MCQIPSLSSVSGDLLVPSEACGGTVEKSWETIKKNNNFKFFKISARAKNEGLQGRGVGHRGSYN